MDTIAPEPTVKKSHRRRRWRWIIGISVVLLLLTPVWLTLLTRLFEPTIRREVLAIAQDLLEPEVTVGELVYEFPLGVRIKDLKLVSGSDTDRPTTILDAPEVDIVLDRLPIFGGPIVFRDFRLHQVTATILSSQDGSIVGWENLLTGSDDVGEDDRPVSEIFSIDRIDVDDLTVVYEIEGNPNRMVLDQLSFEIDSRGKKGNTSIDLGRGPGWYAIDTELKRPDFFTVTLAGGLDIDTLDVELERLGLVAMIEDDDCSHLPPQLQSIIVEHRIEGKIDASVEGFFNLREPRRDDTRFDVTLGHTTLAIDQFLVDIDQGSLAGRYEREVLIVDPVSVDLFGGSISATLKVADEATRGLPPLPDSILAQDAQTEGEVMAEPEDPQDQPTLAERLAKIRDDTGKLIPEAALAEAVELAKQYRAVVTLRVDDVQLSNIHRLNQTDPSKLAGIAEAAVDVDFNLGAPLKSAGGGGQFQVTEGRFTGGPLVKGLASVMRLVTLSPGEKDWLVGEFLIRDESLVFSSLQALAGPIGIRATGSVDFDGRLNLRANAGPLEGLQSSAGKLGSLTAAVTDRLVRYLIRGTIDQPRISVAPLGIDLGGGRR